MLAPLHLQHQRLRHHPRTRTWRLLFSFGLGAGAENREILVLAPASEGAAVMSRLHNGILLLQPATVQIDAPVEEAELPLLATLRELHPIPISVNEPPGLPGMGEMDLPSMELPEPVPIEPGTLAVGLDIGGTGMKSCAIRDGRVVRTAQAVTWPEGEQGLASLVRRARALVSEVAAGEVVGSLGIGFASPMGIGGQVVSLSTVMQQKIGDPELLEDFPDRVAKGLTRGAVAFFNDLANLGLSLATEGQRRMLRLQIGTSFGGCWIDANGTVNPAELGRLVVDVSPDARPHTYLPLRGAMKSYLSNYGIALTLSELLGERVSDAAVGFRWEALNQAADPRGQELAQWVTTLIDGVIHEARVFLPGLETVELGGGMLQGATGRLMRPMLAGLHEGVTVRLARDPGYDGAIAAARAPLRNTPLRGMRRLGAA